MVALCVAALMVITAMLTLLAPYLAALLVLFIIYKLVVKSPSSDQEKVDPPP